MYVLVNDVKLFFDVEGAKLRPDGAVMREVPTLLLLHGGPGFDHSGCKPAFTEMAAFAQVIYLDLRGHGRSDAGSTTNGHSSNGPWMSAPFATRSLLMHRSSSAIRSVAS